MYAAYLAAYITLVEIGTGQDIVQVYSARCTRQLWLLVPVVVPSPLALTNPFPLRSPLSALPCLSTCLQVSTGCTVSYTR